MRRLLPLLLLAGCMQADERVRIEGASTAQDPPGRLGEGIGIAAGPRLVPVLAGGCTLPCSGSQALQAASPDQAHIRFRLHQGRAEAVAGSRPLGTYEVAWPGTAHAPGQVTVQFTADSDGAYLTALDPAGEVELKVARVQD